MSPVWFGLLVAPLIARFSGSTTLGRALMRLGVLLAPFAVARPDVLGSPAGPAQLRMVKPKRPPLESPAQMPLQILTRQTGAGARTGLGRLRV
jgi:hypothetical protein